jgi:hypothetical protein
MSDKSSNQQVALEHARNLLLALKLDYGKGGEKRRTINGVLNEIEQAMRGAVETTGCEHWVHCPKCGEGLRVTKAAKTSPVEPTSVLDRNRDERFVGRELAPEKATEQLYRLRPLCICDNALTNQNPACPVHGEQP